VIIAFILSLKQLSYTTYYRGLSCHLNSLVIWVKITVYFVTWTVYFYEW